jgi:hypothetical protein
MTSPYEIIKSAVLGSPLNPNKQLSRQGIVRGFAEMQRQLEAAQAGAIVKDNYAALTALSSVPYAGIMAWVMSGAQSGIYENTGTANAPAWTRRGDIPQFLINGLNTGEGTANAIKIDTDLPVPTDEGRAMIVVPILADNTASPVSVSINDGAALTIVSNSGNNIEIGGLKAGMYVAGFIVSGQFRLLSDQATAALVSAAEAAAALAEYYASMAGSGADVEYTIKSPSSYLTTARTTKQRLLDGGVSILDAGGSGGVKPGQGNANADTQALLNLGNDMGTQGGTLLFPAGFGDDGVYVFNDRLVIPKTKYAPKLKGVGMGRTKLLRVPGGTAGMFKISQGTPTQMTRETVEIEDLYFGAYGAIAGFAIDIDYETAVGAPTPGPVIRRCTFSGVEKQNQGHYWKGGIILTNAREGNIRECWAWGPDGNATSFESLVALRGGTVGTIISENHVYSCQTPISVADQCEGVYPLFNQLVYVNEGIVWVADAAYFGVDLVAIGNHCNALTGFIRGYRVSDLHAVSNQIQKRDESTIAYTDFKAQGYCNTWKLIGNDARLRGTSGAEYFLVVDDAAGQDAFVVTDNIINNRDTAFVLGSQVTNALIHDNKLMNDVTGVLANSSTSPTNQIYNNTKQDVQPNGTIRKLLTANVAVPSVSGHQNQFMLSINSAPTTITGFADGYAGQIIQLLAGAHTAGTTSLGHGTNLILIGGVTRTFGPGSVATFMCENGTVWREI